MGASMAREVALMYVSRIVGRIQVAKAVTHFSLAAAASERPKRGVTCQLR